MELSRQRSTTAPRRVVRWALLLSVFSFFVAFGPALLSRARLDVATIDVVDIKPGMKGFGLSVFRGTRPERFDVEVIDVLPNFRPGQDLILIRTPHPLLNHTQAVAGMSGSPIYLDGKLAGAYAYGWPFGRDPVVGVTPIKDMLRELTRPVDMEIFRMLGPLPMREQERTVQARRARDQRHRDALAESALPAYRSRQPHGALWALRKLTEQDTRNSGSATTAIPAQTPIMLSGLTDGAATLLSEAFAPLGLLPLQAGGGSTAAEGDRSGAGYVNGGAIGVQLIRGDMSATGVGTVTHVDGQRLVAFGHPMMNVGQTALPTTSAEVVHVLASVQRSFKMARPLSPLGALVHDRQSAIVVDTELTAATIPVRLSIVEAHLTGKEAPKHEWSFEVASHRALSPVLIFTAIVSGLQATLSDRTYAIVEADTRMTVANHGEMRFTDTAFFPGGVASPSGLAELRLFSAMDAVYGNPFEHADVTAVEVKLSVRFSDAVSEVLAVRVPYSEVDPGETVPALVTLRDFDGQEHVRSLPVTIPKSAAGQSIEIEVSSGAAVQPELPLPRDLDDLLAGLKHAYPANSLVLSTKLPSQGLRMRGHLLPRLPDSVLASLHNQSSSQRNVAYHHETRHSVMMDRVLYGSAKIQLDVREQAE